MIRRAQVGAVVPSNVVYQMQERRSMALTLYRAEIVCLWETARMRRVVGPQLGPLGPAVEIQLAHCAVVQRRHERIMAAAVQTFDLMTWGRETGLQAI